MFWIYPTADLGDTRFSAYFRFAAATSLLLAVTLFGINRWVAMFFVLCLVSSVYPKSSQFSTMAIRTVFIGCLWFYIICQIKQIDRLYDAICILALFNAIWVIVQCCGYDPIFDAKDGSDTVAITGFLSNPNEVSAFFSFCLPAFFRKRWAWIILLIIPATFCASTSGGIVAMAVSIMVYTHLKGGWLNHILFFSAAAIAATYIFIEGGSLIPKSLQLRMDIWEKSMLGMFPERPILGCGIGHWKVVFAKLFIDGNARTFWMRAHNEYVQGLFEMGIVFGVCVIGYFIGLVKKYLKSPQNMLIPITAMTAIIVNSCVNFPFHVAQTAMVAITWMGVVEIINKGDTKCQTT